LCILQCEIFGVSHCDSKGLKMAEDLFEISLIRQMQMYHRLTKEDPPKAEIFAQLMTENKREPIIDEDGNIVHQPADLVGKLDDFEV